jgi:TetR/AcrR family transcriptional regulator
VDEQPMSKGSGPRGSRWRGRIAANAELAARAAAVDRAMGHAERLVAATRELIAETGATSFTVQDIARRANVSLSTVYTYFSSKDELLVAVLEEAIRVATDRLEAQLAACDDPLDRLRVAIVGPLLYAAGPDRPADTPALSRERDRLGDLFPAEAQAATDQLVDVLRTELAAAARAGWVTPLDPERDATAIYHLWSTELRELWRAGGFDEVEAAADYLWRLCCRFLEIPAEPEAPGDGNTGAGRRPGTDGTEDGEAPGDPNPASER